MKSNKLLSSLTALLCCALWGISTPIVKMGYAHVDESHLPSLFAWVGTQFMLAGLMTVIIYSIISKKIVFPKKAETGGILTVSLLQTVLQYSLLYIGLVYTTSVKGAILKSTDVFFVALLAGLVFRLEKLNFAKILSCILGFAGIIIMNLDGLSLNITIGDGLVTLAILFYSLGVIAVKVFAKKQDPVTLSAYQMLIGGAVLMMVGFSLGGKFDLLPMLPIILTLSAIYAVSYSLWSFLLKYCPASGIIIYSFTTPVFGVIFSALLLTEDSGVAIPSLVIAMLLVCVGIVLSGIEKEKK